MCSTGSLVSSCKRCKRFFPSHGDREGAKVDTMISSTRSSAMASSAAENGSGWATWPCASIPSPRSSARARLSRRSASGCSACVGSLCGEMIKKLALPRAARSRIRSSNAWPTTVSFARTRTFLTPVSAAMSTTTCSTGTLPALSRMRSTTFLRSQPDFCCGCVARMISSTGGSSWASASRTAVTGSVSTTSPCAEMPSSRSIESVRSSRLPAAARRVSS